MILRSLYGVPSLLQLLRLLDELGDVVGHVDLSDSQRRVGLVKMFLDVVVGGELRRNLLDEQGPGEVDVHVLEVVRFGELLHPHDGQEEENESKDVVGIEVRGPREREIRY